MRNLIPISSALIAVFSAFAAHGAGNDEALDGVWQPVAAEIGGKPMAEAVVKTITLKIHKGEYEVTVVGEPGADKGTCVIDSKTKPGSMRITGVAGPNAGRTLLAIYELNADRLRVCYDLSGAKTPTEFKTRQGTRLYLVTYQRKGS